MNRHPDSEKTEFRDRVRVPTLELGLELETWFFPRSRLETRTRKLDFFQVFYNL